MKKTLPVRPFLTSRVISARGQFDLGAHQRRHLRRRVLDQVTDRRVGLGGVRVDQRYRGHGGRYAILPVASLTEHFLPDADVSRVHVATWRPGKRSRPSDRLAVTVEHGRVGHVDGGWILEDQRPLPDDFRVVIGGAGCALLAPPLRAHADEPVPLGGGSGIVVNGDTLLHADRDRQRQPRQPDRLHLRALRRTGRTGGRRRCRGRRRARHDGRGQRRPRLRGDPVRPAEGAAGQQRQRTSRSTASAPTR